MRGRRSNDSPLAPATTLKSKVIGVPRGTCIKPMLRVAQCLEKSKTNRHIAKEEEGGGRR